MTCGLLNNISDNSHLASVTKSESLKLLPSRKMQSEMLNILGKSNPTADEMKPPEPPVLTEEQKAQVMKFLDDLEYQREHDPEAYKKNMEALGLPVIPDTAAETGSSMANLSSLVDAIGSMRTSSQNEGPKLDVNLPGGKSILGAGGIQNKVILVFSAIHSL
jgi:hypothetical protein